MQKKYAIILILLLVTLAAGGVLEIVSDPPGAEVILNHIRTGRFTPTKFSNLPDKEVVVTLLLEEYHFEERRIVPGINEPVIASFSQMTDFDTLAITGDSLFGILQLSKPPVQTPYLINEIIEDRSNVILSHGFHRIEWDGGISYEPIDTIVEIKPGRIVVLDLLFNRRYGRVDFATVPDYAAIEIDSQVLARGILKKPLPAGKHYLKVSLQGYLPYERDLVLFPGQTMRDTIALELSPDKDGDGFHDTVDICPESFGIYDGCPSIQKREEFRRMGTFFGRSFLSAPFTVEFAPFTIQTRFATDGGFRELISLFNDGPALLNNYSGVALANKLWLSRGLVIGSLEGSYSFSGLAYQKRWAIPLSGDSTQYLVYDRFRNDNPEIAILSLGFQGGIQLFGETISFAFLTGYQYETIEIFNITEYDESGNSRLVSEKKNNSSWNTTVRTTISLRQEPIVPRIYGEMSFAPGKDKTTGWVDLRLGVIVPWWKTK